MRYKQLTHIMNGCIDASTFRCELRNNMSFNERKEETVVEQRRDKGQRTAELVDVA